MDSTPGLAVPQKRQLGLGNIEAACRVPVDASLVIISKPRRRPWSKGQATRTARVDRRLLLVTQSLAGEDRVYS